VKKAFTLLELVVVIILITTTYYLVFSNTNFSVKNESSNFSLKSLKQYLLSNFKFEKKLDFLCIQKELKCYIRIDDEIKEDFIIENVFEEKPEVYEYNKDMNVIDYRDVNINNISENIVFLFSINSDYKGSEIILDTLDEKVYLFNSIFNEAKIFTSTNEVLNTFDEKQIEVQDAF